MTPMRAAELERVLDHQRRLWARTGLDPLMSGPIGDEILEHLDAIDRAYDALDWSDRHASAAIAALLEQGDKLVSKCLLMAVMLSNPRYRLVRKFKPKGRKS